MPENDSHEEVAWADEQRLTYLWSIIEHTSQWILAADNKAAVTLAINGVTIGFMFSSGFELATDASRTALTRQQLTLLAPPAVLGILFLLLSLMSAILCLLGRTGIKNIFAQHFEGRIDRPSSTLIFFGSTAQQSRTNYIKLLQNETLPAAINDLSGQIHVLANIASSKYLWVNRAIVCLVLSILFFAALAVMTSLLS